MTWARELQLVRTPLVGNWDFDSIPVAFPGEDFDGNSILTGDRSNPAIWLDFDVARQPGNYLASGNSNSRYLTGTIDIAILVEPVAEDRTLHTTQADLLETYYNAGSTSEILFRVPEAYMTEVFLWEETWLRSDWVCPFWRWEDLAQTEEAFLAGQSSNQKQITHAIGGLALGQWVGLSGGSWALADRTTPIAAEGVVSTVTDATTATITTGDVVKITAHGETQGTMWLDTAGAARATEPPLGASRQQLGTAIDADYLVVRIGELTPG